VPIPLNATTVVPFNLELTSNPLGAGQFDTSTGIFTIPISGAYRIDYGVAFTAFTGTVVGSSITSALRQNQLQLSNAIFTFYLSTTAAAATNTLNSFWTGDFKSGDKIFVTVFWNGNIVCNITGTTVGGVAPFNTLFSIRSLF